MKGIIEASVYLILFAFFVALKMAVDMMLVVTMYL